MNQLSSTSLLLILTLNLGACGVMTPQSPPELEHKLLVPTAVKSVSPPLQNGSIYQAHNSRLLFDDLKARRPGDLITVILDENTVAAKSASTRSSKDTSIDIPVPTILGTTLSNNNRPLSTTLEGSNSFSGAGDSNQSNSLNGNITVTVVQITDTGNLIIKGEKLLTLNSGHEVISISGVVRPTDVTPDNTVISTLIADANIVYSGRGLIADNNRAGWLTRAVNSKFWPF